MIRLRAAVFRGLGHPWLGPVVLLLLGLFLALILLHVSIDQVLEVDGPVCLVLVTILVAIVPFFWIASRVRPARLDDPRAPPLASSIFAVAQPIVSSASSPLRL